MRAVLDSNIIVSALIEPKGYPAHIVRSLLIKKSFESVLSKEILNEIQRVLNYPHIRNRIKLKPSELVDFLYSWSTLSLWVVPRTKIPVVSSDPQDDIYIWAAIEAQADYIVTGDQHILSLENYEGVRMIKPKEFATIVT